MKAHIVNNNNDYTPKSSNKETKKLVAELLSFAMSIGVMTGGNTYTDNNKESDDDMEES